MTPLSKKRVVAGLSFTCLFIGIAWAASNKGANGLTLPQNKSSNITLDLKSVNSATDPSKHLSVYVGSKAECCFNRSPMAGRFSTTGNTLVFDPFFDLTEGQAYTIVSLDNISGRLSAPILTEFILPQAAPAPVPKVVAIYPSGDAIPENTLRFYIHFSVPMKPHVSMDFIKLVDSNGKADAAAFINFKQELWSEDRKRLTVLMDPGRIKRGVAQNLSLGPALQENMAYSIIVEPGWQSANDAQTLPRFEKPFKVSQALRTLSDTKLWAIKPPRANSKDLLQIRFNRIFDYHSGISRITVQGSDAKPILGKVSIQDGETLWQFDPMQPWPADTFYIIVDSQLEDVAGNNFTELLDHAVGEPGISTKREIVLEVKPLPN